MAEGLTPPGIIPVPNKEEPLPFFRTATFPKHPKYETTMSFVRELVTLVGDVTDDDRKDERLAKQMETIYGKEDAMEILENVNDQIRKTIARVSYRDTTLLSEYAERSKMARGIIGTPNWVHPKDRPKPTTFSIK